MESSKTLGSLRMRVQILTGWTNPGLAKLAYQTTRIAELPFALLVNKKTLCCGGNMKSDISS
jgi:hypothetical protein